MDVLVINQSFGQTESLTWWWHQRRSQSLKVILRGKWMSRQFIQKLMTYFTLNQKRQPHGGAAGKVRWSPKSFGFILWAPWSFVQNLTVNHKRVVKIFQFPVVSMAKNLEKSGIFSTINNLLTCGAKLHCNRCLLHSLLHCVSPG